MRWLAGLFLIAHGLVHLAIWLPRQDAKAPFDVGHSPFAGDVRRPATALAIAAAVVLAVAGLGVLTAAPWWVPVTVAGAGVSAALLVLTFNLWWLIGLGINVAIIVLALQQAG
ncbi:hypothetical protein [Arthrobacter sp. B3I4]|uniref:hypothetical protein n=1 Tax=Arthrobacter sp. B3I4 TaxID=3042267 RepID=UPI0027850796|nr:hypothetical protein [Arthrobacter sp. B3I4]MDQ0754462.1 hypothetical protein [Arthrobacter sp. B3I4]